MLLFHWLVFPFKSFFLLRWAFLDAGISPFADAFHGFLFLFILSHNLSWDYFRDWHCEYPLTNGLKHNDPIVTASSISNFPFLGSRVPSMATANSCLNLIYSERSVSFMFMNNNTLFNYILEHLINNMRFQRQTMISCIVMKLFKCDTVVNILVTCPEEGLNYILRNLKRSVSLIQIFWGTLIITTIDYFFHAHC